MPSGLCGACSAVHVPDPTMPVQMDVPGWERTSWHARGHSQTGGDTPLIWKSSRARGKKFMDAQNCFLSYMP